MVNWDNFQPSDFEYDFEHDKLYKHRISIEECIECFQSDYRIKKNKDYKDRFQLIGTTRGGRRLKVIFEVKRINVVRIITGWEV